MSTDKPNHTRSAVILARGLGTRMRKADPSASLEGGQAAAADSGMKGMIPIGRPFMDYLLGSLADAGFTRVCLVIGPEHGAVRDHYEETSPPSRLSINFAIQEKPLGTADAVMAAEEFAGREPFVVLNSDNYYPSHVLERLRQVNPPAIIGFARSTLVEAGNVPPDRVGRFGALEIDADDNLVSITPRAGVTPEAGGEVYASMNCWLFDSRIFETCRRVAPSPRGELELPRAVQSAIDSGEMTFKVIRMNAAVLDMSTRGDIANVKAALSGVSVTY